MKTLPRFLLISGCVGSFLQPGHGQVAYKEEGRIVAAQRALPSTGPGSAWFNPAALSETRLAHGQAGFFSSVSGKASRTIWDLSATLPRHLAPWLPVGLSGGFARDAAGSKIDNSNAVYVEAVYRPSLALAYPSAAEGPYRLAAGLAFPIYTYDAFGAAKSSSSGLDLGLLGIVEEEWAGRFRLGFTWHSLVNPKVRLPDGRGQYNIPGWGVASFGYVTPGEGVRFHWEYHMEKSQSDLEGSNGEFSKGMNALEVEVKPIPWLGIKAEIARVSNQSSLGTVFYPVLGDRPIRFYLEANIGHDKLDVSGLSWFLRPGQDEGRGYLFGLSLGAGI